MKKLLFVSLAILMFLGAWIAPSVSSQSTMPAITALFGYERSEKEDVIYFRNNDILRGTVLDEVVNINTPYGNVPIPVRKCAGFSFEDSPANTVAVVTLNFNRFTGLIGNRILKFKIDSSGEIIEVSREMIRYVLLKRTVDEQDFISSDSKTNLFVMTNGDLITGKPSPAQIIINTEYADLKVGFEEIKDIVMQGGIQPIVVITKKNGDIMRGKLVTEELTLVLDVGTSVEAVHKDKFAKVYMEDGNVRVVSLFTGVITVTKTPANAIIKVPSAAQDLALTLPGPDQVQLKMKLIPAGTFIMGSPSGETDRSNDEGPQHQVVISKPFYMGIYEVTQAQWAAVMGTYPSKFGYIPANPVEQVDWEDCQKFIQKLNTMGLGTFRLPTEAEWEYACRAGSTTRFPWGDDPNYSLIGQYAWFTSNSNSKTNFVGQKKPNTWGLYDMNGNVFEWCSDWYAASYSIDNQIDPKGPATGSARVSRSSYWGSLPKFCRSAKRSGGPPNSSGSSVGFRLVRMVP